MALKKENNSLANPLHQENSSKESLSKKPLLIKPNNNQGNSLISSNKNNTNKLKNPAPPSIVSKPQSQALLNTQNKTNNAIKTTTLKDKQDPIRVVQDKKSLKNTSIPTKSPTRPPIQLIEKPKNLTTSNRELNLNKKK